MYLQPCAHVTVPKPTKGERNLSPNEKVIMRDVLVMGQYACTYHYLANRWGLTPDACGKIKNKCLDWIAELGEEYFHAFLCKSDLRMVKNSLDTYKTKKEPILWSPNF